MKTVSFLYPSFLVLLQIFSSLHNSIFQKEKSLSVFSSPYGVLVEFGSGCPHHDTIYLVHIHVNGHENAMLMTHVKEKFFIS